MYQNAPEIPKIETPDQIMYLATFLTNRISQSDGSISGHNKNQSEIASPFELANQSTAFLPYRQYSSITVYYLQVYLISFYPLGLFLRMIVSQLEFKVGNDE